MINILAAKRFRRFKHGTHLVQFVTQVYRVDVVAFEVREHYDL